MGVLDLMSRERKKAKEGGECTVDLGELEEVEDGEFEDVEGDTLQKSSRREVTPQDLMRQESDALCVLERGYL